MITWIVLGSLNMFISVAMGAFGAHALKNRLSPEMSTVFQTGVQYQTAHALGLLFLAAVADRFPDNALLAASGWLLSAGIVLFSGSLYALSLSGVKKLGGITPLGGLAFLAGWALLLVAVLQG